MGKDKCIHFDAGFDGLRALDLPAITLICESKLGAIFHQLMAI